MSDKQRKALQARRETQAKLDADLLQRYEERRRAEGVVVLRIEANPTTGLIRTHWPDAVPSRAVEAVLLLALKGIAGETPIHSNGGAVMPKSGLILPGR